MAVLDPRMFKEDAFISNDIVLMQVKSVSTTGKFPNRKRTVWAEDCKTEVTDRMTEKDLAKFHWINSAAA